MQSDVEAFWSDFEKEIGEKIRSKTMCQHFDSKKSQGEWGLLVLSESTLRFRATPGENWFQSLFKMAAPKVSQEPREDVVLPLRDISGLELPKKHFFDFLFSPPFTVITLRYAAGGEAREVLFGVDTKAELFKILLATVPRATAP